MPSIFDKLVTDELICDYPAHLKNNIHYECIMGSTAYGVSNNMSDVDVYGFSIPPKHILFPYSFGNIVGFGNKPENFEQFQKHHIKDEQGNKEYDVTIYNIVKYFQLCMENNPNMVDSLFVPTRCVLHCTSVGNHVRENRKEFISKKVWHSFKGYAFAQLGKMNNKYALEFVKKCKEYGWGVDITLEEIKDDNRISISDYGYYRKLISKIEQDGKRSKRLPSIMKYGYDVKFGYHVVRLLDECQQMLEEGDLDLTRSREHLKAIRRGEFPKEYIVEYFDKKLIALEELYGTSKLRYSPDEAFLKNLLLECLEMHYGSLDKMAGADRDIDKHIISAYNALEKAMRYIK